MLAADGTYQPSSISQVKYLPLIWAGLWRKPVRTTLTFFSIASVFLLFGSLYGVSAGFDAAIARVSANRLRVASSDGYRTLPLGYRQKIERVPGVATTMIATAISGYYQQPRNMLNIFAAGGDVRLEVFGEIKNTASHVAALRANRTGVLVGRQLAERFGWKVGDRVPVITGAPNRDGRNVLDFDIAGIYDVPTAPASANLFLINFDYLEEERIKGKGKTGMFFVDTVDPARNVEVSRAIDQLFINSEISTDTQTEREYQRTLITNALDVKLIVHAIVFASVFALLVLCGNTLMQSVRERIPEMAMLKTLGFSPTALVLLVLAEGVVLCTLAALLGLLASTLLFPTVALAVQVPALAMPLYVPVVGILVAVIAAVLSTAAPALRAGRLSIVDALAGR